MEKTLYLEAAREGETLKIGIREHMRSDLDPCISPYEVKELTMEKLARIEAMCLQTMDFLGAAGGRNDINKRVGGSLKKMGEMLSDELLTPRIKETILNSDAAYLIIRIEDRMVQIPWELICLNDQFLCERFNVGRIVRTCQEISEVKSRKVSYPIDMWILANPGKDLPSADEEGNLLLRITDGVNPDDATVINASLDSTNVTTEKIRSKIKNSDIVHFAGHAEYNSESFDKGGWKISGEYFSPKDIDKMAGNSKMPVIVFSNACQSARTDAWKNEKNSFGIVNAFLRAGVKYYVGTSWEIMDTPSTQFSCEFYNQLYAGKSIGECVRVARAAIKEKYSDDYVGWAGYLLYGDPRYKIYDSANDTSTLMNEAKKPLVFQAAMQGTMQGGMRGNRAEKDLMSFDAEEGKRKTGGVILAVFAVFLVFAGILGYGFFSKRHELEASRMQKEWTYREKERNDALIQNISKNMEEASTPQGPNADFSNTVTAAVVYDAYNPKAGMVATKMKAAMKKKHTGITFLERQELNVLLEEVNLAMSLPGDKKLRLNMLPADFIIKLTEPPSGGNMEINVLSTETGENLLQERTLFKNGGHLPDETLDHIIATINK